jgi:divalent metal cation (Fe/Co/Zn/Cd) transporter
LIAVAFIGLATYLSVQCTALLLTGFHPHHSAVGIAWTATTALVMFALAAGKRRTGSRLDNPVLTTEGRVTFIDGLLATAVLVGLALNTIAGMWWADPVSGFVIVYYAINEVREILRRENR